MDENIKCCICQQSRDGMYLRTPHGKSVCHQCAIGISHAVTSYMEYIEKGFSDMEAAKMMNTKALNNLRKDGDEDKCADFEKMLQDLEMECDEDELSRMVAEDPELEDEYDLFHPRLIELVKHRYDIDATDVLVRLYKYMETPRYANLDKDELLISADVFCELYCVSRGKKNALSHLKQSIRNHPLLKEIDQRITEILIIELEVYSPKRKQGRE